MGTSKINQISLTVAGLVLALFPVSANALVGGQAAAVVSDPNLRMEASAGCIDGACAQNAVGGLQVQASELLHLASGFSADGKDPMKYAPRTGALAPIGRIDVQLDANDPRNPSVPRRAGSVSGTAFLISPCYIYTSKHVVFGKMTAPSAADGRGVTFSVGQGSGQSFKYTNVPATPVVWSTGDSRIASNDVAIMKLDRCVGEDPTVGWAYVRPQPTSDLMQLGNVLQVAGYPAGRDPNLLSLSPSCSIRAYDSKGGNLHDCSAQAGMSGAPLFMVRNNVPVVVGVHTFESRGGAPNNGPAFFREYSHDLANTAGQLTDLRSEIDDLILNDYDRFGRPNPLDQGPAAQRARARLASSQTDPSRL